MVCNKWTGVVLIFKFLIFVFWNSEFYNKKRMYNFVKNVTEGESNRQGPQLICETKNKALISNDRFYSAPLCLFLELHVHIVL